MGGTISTARKESAKEKQLKEEEKILESVAEGRGTQFMIITLQYYKIQIVSYQSQSNSKTIFSALMSVKEMAKGIIYDDPIKTR